jgi:hypothetical protein
VELKPREKTKEAKRARRVLDLLRVRAALSSGSRIDQREGGMGGGEEEKKRRERRVLGVYLVPGTCGNFEPLDVNLPRLNCFLPSLVSFSLLY